MTGSWQATLFASDAQSGKIRQNWQLVRSGVGGSTRSRWTDKEKGKGRKKVTEGAATREVMSNVGTCGSGEREGLQRGGRGKAGEGQEAWEYVLKEKSNSLKEKRMRLGNNRRELKRKHTTFNATPSEREREIEHVVWRGCRRISARRGVTIYIYRKFHFFLDGRFTNKWKHKEENNCFLAYCIHGS